MPHSGRSELYKQSTFWSGGIEAVERLKSPGSHNASLAAIEEVETALRRELVHSAVHERGDIHLPHTEAFAQLLRSSRDLVHLICQDRWALPFLRGLELHHPESYDHSLRVGFLAFIAAYNSADYRGQGEQLFRAGVYHDIGKAAIPKEILNAAVLTEQQRALLDLHPRIGFEMIKPFDLRIAEIMVAHHELQERSYPRSVYREDEDLDLKNSRIRLACADAVEALRSERSYKPSWSEVKTRDALVKVFDRKLLTRTIDVYQTIG
jgi:HD-GYP domain-containing protein (c-di-GMP phosphodiesterase class II)